MKPKHFLTVLLILIVIPAYLFRINLLPANVTGDEITYLGDVYRIIYSPQTVNPLTIMGDGSQPATNFYWMSFWIQNVGLQNSILGMRLSTAILSIFGIIAFYYLLSRRIPPFLSFFTSLLLATSVWYMNFARSGWFNLGAVLWGLLMVFYIEKGLEEKKLRWFGLAGLFAGIASY